jgi:inhibitor of cysteine peptidase
MPTIDEGANGKTIELAVGDQLEIHLAENPTTGFRWHLTTDGAPACERTADSFTASGTRPGAGGIHAWHFRAARQGQGRIEFGHGRSWRRDADPGRSFAVTVKVS